MTEDLAVDENEIPEGSCRLVEFKGFEIGIFKVRGRYYALRNWCVHQGGPVCTGRISGTLVSRRERGWKVEWASEGQIVTCPWHGLEYDITTGQSLAFENFRLKRYPVKVEAGKVKVQL